MTVIPVAVTKAVLERGEERYNIFCAPCHDAVGNGSGMIVQRGFRQPPSLHIPRLRDAPIGHFYDVMSNGFGLSPDFSSQVSPEDRWAIAAYIRALQLSQHAPVADVPADERRELEAKGP
jgi:cytochrome c